MSVNRFLWLSPTNINDKKSTTRDLKFHQIPRLCFGSNIFSSSPLNFVPLISILQFEWNLYYRPWSRSSRPSLGFVHFAHLSEWFLFPFVPQYSNFPHVHRTCLTINSALTTSVKCTKDSRGVKLHFVC